MWFKGSWIEPKPCKEADGVRKLTSVVICTISLVPEDFDLNQVTSEIQHSPRFLCGTVKNLQPV